MKRSKVNLLLNPPRPKKEDDIINALEMWEVDLMEYESNVGKELDDGVKIGIVQNMVTDTLQRHLLMNTHRLDTRDKVRMEVTSYLKASQGPSSSGANDDAMGVGAIGEGKGKTGKKKGKEKGNGAPQAYQKKGK